MARFIVRVTADYEVDDDRLMKAYGTDDVMECAKIDEENGRDLPDELLELCDHVLLTVEPVL